MLEEQTNQKPEQREQVAPGFKRSQQPVSGFKRGGGNGPAEALSAADEGYYTHSHDKNVVRSIEKFNLIMKFIHRKALNEGDRRFLCFLIAQAVPDMNNLDQVEDTLRLIETSNLPQDG